METFLKTIRWEHQFDDLTPVTPRWIASRFPVPQPATLRMESSNTRNGPADSRSWIRSPDWNPRPCSRQCSFTDATYRRGAHSTAPEADEADRRIRLGPQGTDLLGGKKPMLQMSPSRGTPSRFCPKCLLVKADSRRVSPIFDCNMKQDTTGRTGGWKS